MRDEAYGAGISRHRPQPLIKSVYFRRVHRLVGGIQVGLGRLIAEWHGLPFLWVLNLARVCRE